MFFRRSMVLGAVAMLAALGFFPSVARAAAPPVFAAGSPEAKLRDHLQDLDRLLKVRLERAERSAAAGLPAAAAEREGASIRRHLEQLEAQARRGDFGETAPWLDRLRALDRLAAELGRAARLDPATAAARVAHRRLPLPTSAALFKSAAPPSNDTCQTALPFEGAPIIGTTVGAGADGAASCSSSTLSPDVWYRFSAPIDGTYFATTEGSAFDTVLSVYDGCPESFGTELTCNDNADGLQSSVGFFAEAGEDYFVRVSGFAGGAGSYALALGAGGVVTGTVRDAATGRPLPFVDVELVDLHGFGSRGAQTDVTGTYRVIGLPPGQYRAIARPGSHFVAQIFGGGNCSVDCQDVPGAAIEVGASSVTTGIDFDLVAGGRVMGVVRDRATGEPIANAGVTLWRRDTSASSVASTQTDGEGVYVIDGLLAGTYAATAGAFDHLDELYMGLFCDDPRFGSCNLLAGQPIEVALAATRTGIDFRLERGGRIAGRVFDAESGQDIGFGIVEAFDLFGEPVRSSGTDSSGVYEIDGLLPGRYVVGARSFSDYLAELYDDVPCSGSRFSFNCDVTAGDQIAVSAGARVEGIDFGLDRAGVISGRVIDATTGQPIVFLSVFASDANGDSAGSGESDANGQYQIVGLEPGRYRVATSAEGSYLDEVWDDVACAEATSGGSDCSAVGGVPIDVGRGAEVGGIDFALRPLGAIAGRITDASTGEPLSDAGVSVYRADGTFVDSTSTNQDGNWHLGGLFNRGYRVVAGHEGYQAQLYDGVPCPDSQCDIPAGRNVQVSLGATTSGIDLALVALGRLEGRVIDQATGAGISFLSVELRMPDGSFHDSTSTDETGHYELTGIEPGTYLVFARSDERYFSELFDDLPCRNVFDPACDLEAAQPIEIRLGETTSGIDFALRSGGILTGTVRHQQTGEPLDFIEVLVRSEDGSEAFTARTDSAGRFEIRQLRTGRYFALAGHFTDYQAEIFRDVPCPHSNCSLDAGTPIDVVEETTIAGIDFTLGTLGAITGRVSDARNGAGVGSSPVEIWNSAGELVGRDFTFELGSYRLRNLEPGVYFVSTPGSGAYLGALHAGLPCLPEACDPTAGQPVRVDLDATTTGIDFALELGAAFSGTVRNVFTGAPVRFVQMALWSAQGAPLGERFTDEDGRYLFEGLPRGTYFVSTRASGRYFDQLYAGIACPEGAPAGCDPTTGTPIVLDQLGQVAAAIDFVLTPAEPDFCDDFDGLCLAEERFMVEVSWRDHAGGGGMAEPRRLTGDAGFFWFLDDDNVEVVVKVIDACSGPDPGFWVFGAGLTNFEVETTVTDLLTGEVKTYFNPLGAPFRPILDTDAFAVCTTGFAPQSARPPAPAPRSPKLFEDCESGEHALCLNQGRFQVEAFFETFLGETGMAHAVELTPDAGYFWFFDEDNVEVVVKVLDGCFAAEPRFWVFAAGLTNVEVLLRVTDTETGAVREYRNPLATPFQPILDTGAFATCP